MKSHNSNFFTVGEFASLCSTTKETLRHYSNTGILRPEKIGENGYQYYSPRQFFDFYLISSLKRAGSPLSDIKQYLARPDAKDLLQILYKQQQCLHRERMMLERMERLIRQSIGNIELALSVKDSFEEPEPTACEEEYFVVVDAPDIQGKSEIDFFDSLHDHVQYCMQNDIGAEFQIGVIVLQDSLSAGSYQPRYFCSRINKASQSERLFVKPKGMYVSMLYKGGIDTSPAYQKIMEYISRNRLTVCGNAYEYELAGYLSTGDDKTYICRISIQVEAN